MKQNVEQNIICNKCHNAILRESLVTCLTCGKTMNKMSTYKFDMNKYSSLQNEILEMPKSQRTNSYICKSCHLQLQPKFTCLCLHMLHKHVCKMYKKVDYFDVDFSFCWLNPVVSW